MVDAQHARVAHVGGVERAEVLPAARADERIGRRQVPVLASGRERIGRGADGCAARRGRRRAPRPRRRPAPRRPRDPGRSRWRGRACAPAPPRRRAAGRRPTGRRARSRNAAGLCRSPPRSPSVRRRARRPARRRQFSPASLAADRLKGREASQRLAAFGDEGAVLGDELVVRPRRGDAGEGAVQRCERRPLDPPDLGVVDEPRRRGDRRDGAERRKRRFGGRVARQAGVESVDQNRVEEPPVGRVVGARPLAVAGKQHVHRAYAEIGRARSRRRFAGLRERRQIADPLIARRAARRKAAR